MKLVIVAVRDSAMDAYARPFFVPNTATAVRSFKDEVQNEQSPMSKHPEDYALWELGTFEEDDGKFENLPSPRQLVRAMDVKETK